MSAGNRSFNRWRMTAEVCRTGDETFGGCSALIDPWGETICEAGPDEETLVTGQLDPAAVEKIRQTIPVFADRRPELY